MPDDSAPEDSTRRAPPLGGSAKVFTLSVVEGPTVGRALLLDETRPPRLLLGKGPACDLRLEDPLVSRRHASVVIGPNTLRLTDLGSTNGTVVNGIRIVEVLLGGGETVRLGASALRVQADVVAAPHRPPTADRFGRVLGGSPEMHRLYPLFQRLAASDIPVVVEGETGTGKELLAESIHEEGPRAAGPFVVFDCAASSGSRLESELFGHESGSLPGAHAMRKGAFELAEGGTLFIDEVGDLDLALQAKLLRAIERFEIQRLGGGEPIRVNVRVVASTRRDLDRSVQEKRFRDELFFRLAVGRVEMPALRDRTGDVAFLARHFWTSLGGEPAEIPPDTVARLEDYAWPGNVRELYNTVARQLAVGELDAGGRRNVGQPIGRGSSRPPGPAADYLQETLDLELAFPRARDRVQDEFERRYVERVLAKHGGNVARAAAASGIARRYFQIIRARSR